MNMMKKYLNNRNISYKLVHETNIPTLVDNIDCLVIPCYAEYVIGRWIELSLRFRKEHVYLMAYYSQVFSTEENYNVIVRFLNYINAQVHYETILDHNVVLDEVTGDIYNGVLIRYETLEYCFYDVMDYILFFQKQLLEDICLPLVMSQQGKWDQSKAIKYIDKEI